jgi:phage terminase large subunit-like protein
VNYLCDREGNPLNAETFDLRGYLLRIPEEFLHGPSGRRELTCLDPLLWACVYTPHLLKSPDGEVTFGDVHLGLYRDALDLTAPAGAAGSRRAYIAPRGSGKSTTLFVITTLWLACHHPTFVAAFSASATQARDHLHAVRLELGGNGLIRTDYPDTCAPVLRRNGTPVADSDSMLYTKAGFTMAARGIDTEVLGLVDPENRRPQVIWLDDIEGTEGGRYSAYLAEQRLKVLTDGILPMNDRAHVRLVGTVTMPGSIMHQLVNTVTTSEPPTRWIEEERFEVTYFPPIIPRSDGTERSVWPGRWPIEHLQSIRRTRSFMKNFANQPSGYDGGYWQDGDIVVGDVPALTRRVIAIDPAVTSKRTSDDTGIAIVAYSPTDGRCLVEHAEGVKLTGGPLREHLARLIRKHSGKIHGIVVEVNQGGDLWHDILYPLGLRMVTAHASESKEIRFATLLDLYQKPRPLVIHADRFPVLEGQMLGFPRAPLDDVVDAVCTGVSYLMTPTTKPQVRSTTARYA